jgi:hypothetical protein
LEEVTAPIDTSEFGPCTITRSKTPEETAAAILALGEPNEHS